EDKFDALLTCPYDQVSVYSIAIAENGEVRTWGWGEHGQLGLGNTCDQTHPQVVDLGRRPHAGNQHLTPMVYCGSGFTFTLRDQLDDV
ncbi:hypothetical protein Dimus_037399, partial [Dionaea muscipula]